MRYALAAVALMLASTAVAQEEMSAGFFVIGRYEVPEPPQQPKPTATEVAIGRLSRCKLKPFVAASRQFAALVPGYSVVAAGPFEGEAQGYAALEAARHCAPRAYLIESTFSSE